MLSNEHESLAELFRHQPSLAAELAADLGVDVPRFASATLEPSDYSDVMPTEWRSDGVVALTDDAGNRAMAIVVEVQLGWPTQKRWVWPVYVAATRTRLRCPAVLLVVCAKPAIAKQCVQQIDTGHPGFVLRPLVLGPDRVPVVTDPELAMRLPELAVLSAIAHREHPDVDQILEALVQGLKVIQDADHFWLYTDVVLDALPQAIRPHLEGLMDLQTYEFKSDYVRRRQAEAIAKVEAEAIAKVEAEGMTKGKADDVLTILAARGIDVPDDARERVTSCADVDQLDDWVRRAATATSADDLFV